MKRQVLLAVALAAGCSSGDGPPPTAALVVATGDDFSELAIFDPDSEATELVEAPTGLEDQTPIRVVVGQNAEHVLVEAVDGFYLWDRRSAETTLITSDGRIVGLHPRHRPALVLVETTDARHLVDLRSGTIQDLGPPPPRPFLSRFAADLSSSVGLVANPDGGALVVEVGSGMVVEHDSDLFFYENGLAGDGSRVVAGRRTDTGQEIVAVDALDPGSMAVWHTPDRLEEQVQVAWVGDQLLAVDLSGRVMTITDGVVNELGRLPEERVGSVRIHRDPASGSALVEEDLDSGSRWFRVDATSRVIDELEAIEGYSVAPFDHPVGHLLVGLGSEPTSFSQIHAVRIADGSVVELFEDPAEPVVVVTSLSDSTVAVAVVGSEHSETHIVGLDGQAGGQITGGPGVVLSPDETRVAVISRGIDEPFMSIVSLEGSDPSGPYPGVRPLAWLPAD